MKPTINIIISEIVLDQIIHTVECCCNLTRESYLVYQSNQKRKGRITRRPNKRRMRDSVLTINRRICAGRF